MLPQEHGAWAMLVMPYLVGTMAAGWGGWPSFLLLAAVLLLFSAGRPLEVALQGIVRPGKPNRGGTALKRTYSGGHGDELRKRRANALLHLATYLALGGLAAALLLLLFGRWGLLPMGAISAAILALQLPLKRRRLDRGWAARLLAIAALSATGPAAYYAASGALDRHTCAVWILCFLYSGAGVFYVRLVYQPVARLRDRGPRQLRAEAGKHMATYLSVTVVTLGGLAALGWMPPRAILALLPTAAKAAWAWARPTFQTSLKRVGMMEVGHSALFALLATVVIAMWG